MPTNEHDDPEHEHHAHDHPILEAFNAEETVEEPGELDEEPDTTSDSDAPSP